MSMYRFLGINELIILGCNEVEVKILGYLKFLGLTPPPYAYVPSAPLESHLKPVSLYRISITQPLPLKYPSRVPESLPSLLKDERGPSPLIPSLG